MAGLDPAIHAFATTEKKIGVDGRVAALRAGPAMTIGKGARGQTAAQLLTAAAELKAAGVEGARRDARILLTSVLGLESNANLPDRALTRAQARKFAAMINRRAKREPVSRILGKRDFWTLTLRLNEATLDPRPDSETVVETVLAHLGDRGRAYRILDLGAGTGCLLLALLSELPNATGLGVDIAPRAVTVARANARTAGLARRARFAVGDWSEGLRGSFDVIVANPPYIRVQDIPRLEPEVAAFDPRRALDGGRDGLAAYRAILKALPRRLAPHALVAFELGKGQARAVAGLLKTRGLQVLETRRDLGGIERCIIATAGRNRHSPPGGLEKPAGI